jgi:hypothetical protein
VKAMMIRRNSNFLQIFFEAKIQQAAFVILTNIENEFDEVTFDLKTFSDYFLLLSFGMKRCVKVVCSFLASGIEFDMSFEEKIKWRE